MLAKVCCVFLKKSMRIRALLRFKSWKIARKKLLCKILHLLLFLFFFVIPALTICLLLREPLLKEKNTYIGFRMKNLHLQVKGQTFIFNFKVYLLVSQTYNKKNWQNGKHASTKHVCLKIIRLGDCLFFFFFFFTSTFIRYPYKTNYRPSNS